MDETYWDSLLDLIKKGSDGDTIMVPNNDSKFFIYDAMDDLKTAGTLVEYKGKKRARKVYRALHHAKETDEHFLLPVRFIADKYWVFPMRLISWGDWLSVLRKDPPALGEVPKIVSSVWRQITKVVKSLFLKKKNCFAKVSDSFGITRDNKVYCYAPPGSKTDFHTNLTDLSDMADDLIGCLRLLKNRFQVSSLNATIDRFVDFRDFVRVTYLDWLRREGDQLSAGTRFQLQLFCLHHPASFDDAGFLRFFNNLGLIGDRDEPTNLGNQAEFRDHIWDTLNDWRQTVSVDEQLKRSSVSFDQSRARRRSTAKSKTEVSHPGSSCFLS
ncbi:PREDICTED: uncharacterized protein LOC101302754 [Fragaria vesca subsp. vesca]|uniref:uncharacterized protein LOC101302754 n=1 Tax=Fragaria vesca subsp. vesca TaxID=101020 RepID=UPI0002C32656|nr:PREDICTED: uncharacterized protein LOC101302754 [Fragaria vesca subsp. vesca]